MTEEKKSQKLTAEEATREVFRLFCRGLTRDRILEHAKAQKWGLSSSALADVIERATESITEVAGVLNLDTEVGKARTRLENLYNDALEKKDTKMALAVQKEINSLLRLSDRVRHSERNRNAAPGKSASPARLIKFAK